MSEYMKVDHTTLLHTLALQLRIDAVRSTTFAGSGHPTSCLSAADIIAVLFFHVLAMKIDDYAYPHNDRFILSKGHAIPLIYAAWKQFGIISDDQLQRMRTFDSPLEGHPTPRFIWNEAATGSLGQGLSIGAGMALNAKMRKLSYTTYVLLGDGELAEGSNWEAADFAAEKKLDNIVAIVDANRLGQSGTVQHDHHIIAYAKKFEAFGWHAIDADGHDIATLISAFEHARDIEGKPTVIIAKTYKGYGLPSLQNKIGFHGKPISIEQLESSINSLKAFFPDADLTVLPPTPLEPRIPKEPAAPRTYNDHPQEIPNSLPFSNAIATREAFGHGLVAIGKAYEKVVVLDADVKNSTYTDRFESAFADRFIECGIAEQNMIGLATGLEKRGLIPFAATFACFMSRAFDQIRMAGIGANALRLCGSHAGVSIGADGPSQMGLEDLALMQSIPNSLVLYPSDGISAYRMCALMAAYTEGISYMRTTRAKTPLLYTPHTQFTIGGCQVLRQSSHDVVCIVAAGITVHEALKAHDELEKRGIAASVIDLYSIKPFDAHTVRKMVTAANGRLITVEDHYKTGGLGEIVSSALSSLSLQHISLHVTQLPRSGSPQKLLAHAKIDAEAIIQAAVTLAQ